ncbi:MAG TPA: tripartite tricarboxylate transporter substrate binding protein [Methylomusa anaerophila]|nr:tripartite tricarboxylate transporter substrate binding protein [Methylomusa anaerophila]HML89785.1 tripartite tricarboxylate transporter substrate binding protein [Methylomusa anaerophila]
MKDKPIITEKKYPDRPITIIVPITAGSSPDIMARAMERTAIKHLGQPLIVKNLPGGAATLGWNELAGSKPDGYTIGVVVTGIILQPLYGPTRYHYPTALEPLAQIVSLPIVAVVRADQPWQSIDDLSRYAKEHPGEIKFGHVGLGSPRHIVGEMFAWEAGITITQVPFAGEPEELTALLEGQVQLIFVHTAVIKEYVKNGKVRVLAVATEQRLTDPVLKDVPTFKEQGLNVVFSLWHGIAAPKGLPEYKKARLLEELREIVTDPEFKQNMESFGMPVDYLGPHEFRRKWLIDNAELADNERLTKIIKKARIPELIEEQKNNNPKEFF